MTFIGDENLPPALMEILARFDATNRYIAFLEAGFIAGVADQEWMPKVLAMPDHPIISQDAQVVRNKAQHIVFKGARGSYICLGEPFGRLNFQQKVLAMVRVWPTVLACVEDDITHDAAGVYLVKTRAPYISKRHEMASFQSP